MMRRALSVLFLSAAGAAVAQPAPEAVQRFGPAQAADQLLIRSTTDIDLLEPVIAAFLEASPEIGILYEQWGSNELYAVADAACHSATGAADLVISSSVDQQVRLVNDGCARPHRSALTDRLPEVANWRSELFGITREPAVIVYNRDLVPPLERPKSRFDLIDLLRPEGSRYAGHVATYDIEDSGLGYLFAFMDSLQATTFGSMIEAFDRTGAVATCCSAEIIDGVVSGRYLVAYNVLGSYALARAATAPNLAVVAPEDYTLVLSRAAMIPKYAANPEAAGRFVDFLLSEPGRLALKSQHLIVDPVEGEAGGLDVPAENQAVLRPIPLTPVLLVGLDQQKRAAFLDLWRGTFNSQ